MKDIKKLTPKDVYTCQLTRIINFYEAINEAKQAGFKYLSFNGMIYSVDDTEMSQPICPVDILGLRLGDLINIPDKVSFITKDDSTPGYPLNKFEAIGYMFFGHKIKHKYFSDDEYLYMVGDEVISEDGYTFTDWIKEDIEWKQTGWCVLEK